jgi:hypothetical protein
LARSTRCRRTVPVGMMVLLGMGLATGLAFLSKTAREGMTIGMRVAAPTILVEKGFLHRLGRLLTRGAAIR